MNATEIAAALSARAEDVCRRYLPRGRRQGRYWTIGDTSGAKGRSLFVRLAPPGIPGKWTDAATNQHGDLLDLIRLHTGGASLRHAMEEALVFLSLPPSTPANGGDHAGGYDREEAARRLWRRCRPIDGTHAEAYLHARAIGHCRFPALRFHPDLIHRDDMTASTASRRWSPPSPAMTAPSRAYSVPGSTPSYPGKPTSPARAKRLGASTAGPCASAGPPPARPCLPARVSKPCYRWSPPSPAFMPRRLYRRAVSAPSNHPKTSPCWSSPAIKTWKAGTPRTVFGATVRERGIPSIVIVPEHSDFNDDLIAFGEETLAARIAPLIATTQARGNDGREAGEWENNHPVMMSHCVTRSHCANPCRGPPLRFAPLRR